jgi:hypothetical protein
MSRKFAGRSVIKWIRKKFTNEEDAGCLTHAFIKNSRPWRSIFTRQPAGWNKRARKKLREIVQEADSYVQMLNDKFTNPSGEARTEQTRGNTEQIDLEQAIQVKKE